MALPVATARSWEGISFTPERHAEEANADLGHRVAAIRLRAAQLADQAGAQPIPAEEVERLVERQAAKTAAYWAAMSRVMSPMITGPARFPVERNRKRSATSDKRRDEALDDVDRAMRTLERIAFPHGMPGDAIRGDDPEALDKLRAKLGAGVNAAERRRLKVRIANLEARQERGRIERETPHFRVVEDPDLDRIQLFFEGRPDDDTRAILKSRGFRWAPSHGAWQRHLNSNGRWAAKYVESDLQKREAA